MGREAGVPGAELGAGGLLRAAVFEEARQLFGCADLGPYSQLALASWRVSEAKMARFTSASAVRIRPGWAYHKPDQMRQILSAARRNPNA